MRKWAKKILVCGIKSFQQNTSILQVFGIQNQNRQTHGYENDSLTQEIFFQKGYTIKSSTVYLLMYGQSHDCHNGKFHTKVAPTNEQDKLTFESFWHDRR